MKSKWQNGFIYPIVAHIVEWLNNISLVEILKLVARRIASKKDKKRSTVRQYCNFAIDAFQLSKWLLVFLLWKMEIDNLLSYSLLSYLVFFNVFSYFYHHIWKKTESEPEQEKGLDWKRRRFIALMQAGMFSNLCFAYCYDAILKGQFDWQIENGNFLGAALMSCSISLTGASQIGSPTTLVANTVVMVQFMITFVFVAIILGSSIPDGKDA